MAQQYLDVEQDSRTFGTQIERLLEDLNRPDFQNFAEDYLKDAIRYFSRQAFFFNDLDNSSVSGWAANTNYTQGGTIRETISGTDYVIVALNAGKSGGSKPTFPATIFEVPDSGIPPPASGTSGTVDDNGGASGDGIIWATVATWQDNFWTQLSTVYRVNQYTPPLDYIAPRLIEIVAASLRYRLVKISFEQLRGYDVIRPAPITTYPTWWSWFAEKIHLWPYPNSFYPLWLNYRTAPPVPRLPTDSNFWTTKAEKLIRSYARGLINEEILRDQEAAALDFRDAKRELTNLRAHNIEQESPGGITPDIW